VGTPMEMRSGGFHRQPDPLVRVLRDTQRYSAHAAADRDVPGLDRMRIVGRRLVMDFLKIRDAVEVHVPCLINLIVGKFSHDVVGFQPE
jgi:hypothetical protein